LAPLKALKVNPGSTAHWVAEAQAALQRGTASASSPALPGGGGGPVPGLAIARPGAEADTPEARALGKRAVSPVGSTAAVVQVVAELTQLLPQSTEGAPGSVEDRPAPVDTEAMPPPQPPPLQTRVAVPKRLQPRSG